VKFSSVVPNKMKRWAIQQSSSLS